MLVKNAVFLKSLPNTMLQICGDVEAVGFPVQKAYKMAYGDESTTFEPVNAYDFCNSGMLPQSLPWCDIIGILYIGY